MAGTGTQEAEARVLIDSLGLAGRIHLLGYRTDTADCLAGADIFTLPTEWENFSLSLLEAMAASLAIITTPAGGNLEAVANQVTAWVAPIGDIAAQRDGLRFFLSDPARRKQFGEAARARMIQEFDVPAAALKMERALQELGVRPHGRGAGASRPAAARSLTTMPNPKQNPRRFAFLMSEEVGLKTQYLNWRETSRRTGASIRPGSC